MNSDLNDISFFQRSKILFITTIAFTICFATWTIFSIIGIKIKQQLNLSDTEFGFLIATPILTGSLSRLILGIWTDQHGGKIVYTLIMIFASISTWFLTTVSTYHMYIFSALGIGLSGGGFAVGVAYVSMWYSKSKQGTALGIFGMGNAGAALTNFGAPFLLLLFDWKGVAKVYSITLFCTAIIFYLLADTDPAVKKRRALGIKADGILKQMSPLKQLRVWRFSLYYFFVFGAFVALALWLPRYYIGVYGLNVKTAGMLTACYSLPGSVFRALGGIASDLYGARKVMYWTFIPCVIILFILSYPATDYVVYGIKGEMFFSLKIGLLPFVVFTIILGFFMSLGKAAVYKHVPVYYPNNVGSVGGIVGLIGGIGGFCFPILFGIMNDYIGVWTSCFMILFLLTLIALTWMHFAIILSEKKKYPVLKDYHYLPELDMNENPKHNK